MELLHTLAGFLVGILVGLTGVGGGALMTPLLVLVFGVPTLTAIGTDLAYAAITKSTGVCCHRQQGSIRWDLVKHLAIGSIPGSLLSLLLLSSFKTSVEVEHVITIVLGFCLLITATLLLFRDKLGKLSFLPNDNKLENRPKQYRLLNIAGFFIGVLVTLSSIGAGALTAAVIFVLFPNLDSRTLVGTDLTHALPLAVIAGAGHLGLGNVDLTLLGSLLIGSLPGVFIGVRLGRLVPEQILRKVLAWLLIILGMKFIYS